MRLQCVVPTSENFTVQFSALHFIPDGSLLANISGGRGQFPATPIAVGVEKLEISLFRMRYWQTIILFCHNTRISDRRMDRRTELRKQYLALHYMQSHGKTSLSSWWCEGFVGDWHVVFQLCFSLTTVTMCICGSDDDRQLATLMTMTVLMLVPRLPDSLRPKSAPCRQRLVTVPVCTLVWYSFHTIWEPLEVKDSSYNVVGGYTDIQELCFWLTKY